MNSGSDATLSSDALQKKQRKRSTHVRLPTPPPDPRAFDTNEKEKEIDPKDAEILKYIESLQKSSNPVLRRSTSVFSSAMAAEDAFDHLEKLYKLMEQMLTLREQNAKLYRRVRDLEHLRNLQVMQKEMRNLNAPIDSNDFDRDAAFTENLLDVILVDTKRECKQKISNASRFRQSILRRQRNRSSSVATGEKQRDFEYANCGARRLSAATSGSSDKPWRVSKWTKVKAAFKWEKAAPTVSGGGKTPDYDNGLIPLNYELARYLRVPSVSEEVTSSPVDSGMAEISTPGSISTTSSLEDLKFGRKEEARGYSSDENQSFIPEDIPHFKDELGISNKDLQKSPIHKNPWAKMKDIIHTRHSSKKRRRLSSHSDDVKTNESVCSDNEDVFVFTNENIQPCKHDIPLSVIERYQKLSADGCMASSNQKISKWIKVKKAFLTSQNLPNTESEKEISGDGVSKRSHDPKIKSEIQQSYKQLQKKLSLEFQDKMSEWEKMKQHSPNHAAGTSSGIPLLSHDDGKDQAFMKKMEEWERIKFQPAQNLAITPEEKLAPEFKKKLQEWQKIKKSSVRTPSTSAGTKKKLQEWQKIKKSSVRTPSTSAGTKKKLSDWPKWKSVGGSRCDRSLDDRPFSDDFLRKLESWKQIKSGHGATSDQTNIKNIPGVKKSPSPKPIKNEATSSRQSKKFKDHALKELHWFDKELSKIEEEKQRLEREKQKFLEREERLSKLKNTSLDGNKEVLVQTPCGFYRFEGISREFTQKLYEWERSQGIAPEASTFTLLNSCFVANKAEESKKNMNKSNLYRSKSVDSAANSLQSLAFPILSEQPSSLSLNDIENLENEIMNSCTSSTPDLTKSIDNLSGNEPEAVIVEVEDIVEETASSLTPIVEIQHTPVYQHQENGKLCESYHNFGPKVRRSESTRAQTNYNLIEEVLDNLKSIETREKNISEIESSFCDADTKAEKNDEVQKHLSNLHNAQLKSSAVLVEKLNLLQDANRLVASNICKEDNPTSSHILEAIDSVQDLSFELGQLAVQLEIELKNETDHLPANNYFLDKKSEFIVKQLHNKTLEVRRKLSYVCAATDITVPNKKEKIVSKEVKETAVKEQEHGAIRKRLKYKQRGSLHKTVDESDEDDLNFKEQRKTYRQRKFAKSKSNSEGNSFENSANNEKITEANIDDMTKLKSIVVPTNISYLNEDLMSCKENSYECPPTVFVKTTRKLFTPTSEILDKEIDSIEISEVITNVPSGDSEVHLETKSFDEATMETASSTKENETSVSDMNTTSNLPPKHASPTPQKKVFKEISPSIRIMLAKYNQKISEQENAKSGGSSGSASPTVWRSPISERRVRAQTERYQQEIQKYSPFLTKRKEVQKSSSAGLIQSNKKLTSLQRSFDSKSQKLTRGILKSSSDNLLSKEQNNNNQTEKINKDLTAQYDKDVNERKLKILRAKETFLNSQNPTPLSAPPEESKPLEYPTRNRFSKISISSESSCDLSCKGLLMKSASAGMINIDSNSFRQFDGPLRGDGYVSLPRSSKGAKEGFFSNITSKFRKVKMRKNKEPKKMNTISTLCRQSLLVDINQSNSSLGGDSGKREGLAKGSSSEDTSASNSRKGSWIKKTKVFNPN